MSPNTSQFEFDSIAGDPADQAIGACVAADESTVQELLNPVALDASDRVDFTTEREVNVVMFHGLPQE